MRWPWERLPWGRGRGADAPAAAAGDTDRPQPGSATPSTAEVAPSVSGVPAAWTRLPPLQRSVADGTAVAPPSAFRSSLTTHQNPSFLAPLGHLVDPDGPGGVVGGLTSSVGGPIPYEGTDELRVPDRPAAPAAPAVQRQIATLRPEVSSPTDRPTPAPVDGPVAAGTDPSADGTSEPAPPSADEHLVVARSVAPTVSSEQSSGTSGGGDGDATVLGAREPVSAPSQLTPGAEDAATVPSPAAAAEPAPLTVPVQRSAAPQESTPVQRSSLGTTTAPAVSPAEAAGHSVAATLRPVTSSSSRGEESPASAAPTPSGTAPTAAPTLTPATSSAPEPAAVEELVVARSAAGPVPGAPDSPAADTLVGLLSDRVPRASAVPSASGDSTSAEAMIAERAAPLTVPTAAPAAGGSGSGSGPTRQRHVVEHSPAPRAGVLPVQRSPAGRSPTPPAAPNAAVSNPAAPSTSGPSTSGPTTSGPTMPGSPSLPGLDEQGYPPLIAVQRRTEAADAGASQAPPPDGSASTPAPAPLSGFSAAISALHDTPPAAPPGGHGESAGDDASVPEQPELVVARRVSPDRSGQLPVPAGRLQRALPERARTAPERVLVQRSLLDGRPPHASGLSDLSPGATVPPAPAVQRLRYEKSADGETRRTVDHPAAAPDQLGRPDQPDELSHPGVIGPADGTSHLDLGHPLDLDLGQLSHVDAPERSAPVTPAPPSVGLGAEWSPAGAGSAWSPPGAPPTAAVQRSPLAPDRPATTTGVDQPPLIQRRLAAPAPGSSGASTTVAPPVPAEAPAMAVSSRTVGLAEMFAMAAAQPSPGPSVQRSGDPSVPHDDGPSVQRATETEVQLAADPSPAPAGSSAAPAGPAASAGPMSGAELEEMARRLYEPLSARLRAELYQDRERSGLLTDLRP